VKTFQEIRDKKPEGNVVYKKKIKRISVEIYQRPDKKGRDNLLFVAYVDGDRLDAFKSQKDAEKAIDTRNKGINLNEIN